MQAASQNKTRDTVNQSKCTQVDATIRSGDVELCSTGRTFPGFALNAYNQGVMAKAKETTFEVACPDCGAMLKIDASTGVVVSHTSAPRKRMFEDLETAAKAMREQDERKESIFRQSVDAERNKADLLEKKFAEAMRKAKDAPEGKPLRDFDLD